MVHNTLPVPNHQLETEVVLAHLRPAEFVHGLESGISEARIADFESQGGPHIHFPDVRRRMIQDARAAGKGLYDREGARAFYYGVRSGIDSVIKSYSKED